MFDLNQLINDLPLEVDGCHLEIWREKGKESWDVAYNTHSNISKEIVWEQGETLLEAVQKMLKKLEKEKHYCKLHSFTGTEADREICPDCNSCEDCGTFLGDSTIAMCKCGKYKW